MTATAGDYAEWCGRLSAALRYALQDSDGSVVGEIRTNVSWETLAQYEAWRDARSPAERGFVHLPGLAER